MTRFNGKRYSHFRYHQNHFHRQIMRLTLILFFVLGAFYNVYSLPTTALQKRGIGELIRIDRGVSEEEEEEFDVTEEAEKIGKAFEVLIAFNDAIGKDGWNIFKDAAGTALKMSKFIDMIGPALGPIGAIFAFAALFISKGPSAELKAINDGFNAMHDRFDAVDLKLDGITELVEKVAVYTRYRAQQEKLEAIKEQYDDMGRYQNISTLEDLQLVCASPTNNPDLVLNWIYKRTVEGGGVFGGDLTETIFKDVKYNRTFLSEFAAVIIRDATEAAWLTQVCDGARYPGDVGKRLNEQQQAVSKITQIINKLAQLDEKVRTDFDRDKVKDQFKRSDQLETDIDSELKKAKGKMDNSEFADHLYEFLKSKYDWLDWSVVVYDPIDKDENHAFAIANSINGHGRAHYRTHGRNVAITYIKKFSNKKELIEAGRKKFEESSIDCSGGAKSISHRLVAQHIFDRFESISLVTLRSVSNAVGDVDVLWSPNPDKRTCGMAIYVTY